MEQTFNRDEYRTKLKKQLADAYMLQSELESEVTFQVSEVMKKLDAFLSDYIHKLNNKIYYLDNPRS